MRLHLGCRYKKLMKYKQRKKKKLSIRTKKEKLNLLKCVLTKKKQPTQEKQMTLFRNCVKVISKPDKLVHLLIATFAVGFGFLLNTLDKMPLFWLKGLFGFVLYMILSCTIKYIEEKNKEIIFELTGDPHLVKCQVDYTKRTNSNFNFILCFVACIYFVTISIILGFVKINPIGIYSLFALTCVVFYAFIIFQHYIFILFLLHDISKISPGNYYELIPERTEWFNLLETFSNICRNIFIVLGSLFILLFIIFSPVNSIQIIFQEKFSSSKFLPLFCTWIIILIAIVFMVPLSSFIRNTFLNKIYKNLISQSIKNYNEMYNVSKGEAKITYMDIILRLNDRKYVLQNSYTWILPLIVSITNFSSVIISILADLKELNILT